MQIVRCDTKYVDDSDVSKNAFGDPLVDRGAADAEQLRDLADGEELLDWWQQIGSKISANGCGSLGSLDGLLPRTIERIRSVGKGW
jgi:hypothetical protein